MNYQQSRTVQQTLSMKPQEQKIKISQLDCINADIFACDECGHVIDQESSQCHVHNKIFCSKCPQKCCKETQKINSRLLILLGEIDTFCERCQDYVKHSEFDSHLKAHRQREKCPNGCSDIFDENSTDSDIYQHQISHCSTCQFIGERVQILLHDCCQQLLYVINEQQAKRTNQTSLAIFQKFNKNINQKKKLLEISQKIVIQNKNKSLKTTQHYEFIWTLISRHPDGFELLNNIEDIISDGVNLIVVKQNKEITQIDVSSCISNCIGQNKQKIVQKFKDLTHSTTQQLIQQFECNCGIFKNVKVIPKKQLLQQITEFLFNFQLKTSTNLTHQDIFSHWEKYYQASEHEIFCQLCTQRGQCID